MNDVVHDIVRIEKGIRGEGFGNIETTDFHEELEKKKKQSSVKSGQSLQAPGASS
jgi:hypothetical protein